MPGVRRALFSAKERQRRATRPCPSHQPQGGPNRTEGKPSLATPDNVVDRNAAEQQPEDA